MAEKSVAEEAMEEAKKIFLASRMPERFWKTRLDKLSFFRCNENAFDTAAAWTPAKQRKGLKELTHKPRNQLVCIGSEPDDEAGLAAASWILQTLLLRSGNLGKIGIVNAAWLYNENFVDVITSDEVQNHHKRQHLPSLALGYIIHNTTIRSNDTHCQGVRNLLTEYTSPVRVVVIAGCDDPFDFCRKRLFMVPDLCCYLKG